MKMVNAIGRLTKNVRGSEVTPSGDEPTRVKGKCKRCSDAELQGHRSIFVDGYKITYVNIFI